MTRINPRSIAMLLALLLFPASGATRCSPLPRDPTSRGSILTPVPPAPTWMPTTLDGKVLCGYQGWFNTPGDGTDFGFVHWGQGLDRPDGGRFTVDMWPDVSEYDPQDLREVPGLKMPDGSPARLYSAYPQGAGPAALQMDAAVRDRRRLPQPLRRRGGQSAAGPARQHRARPCPRGLPSRRAGLGDDARPVDGSWRVDRDRQGRLEVPLRPGEGPRGFALPAPSGEARGLALGPRLPRPPWTPAQGEELVDFFKDDPKYGGVYLIGGVDPFWRTLRGESRRDAAWSKVYRSFDAISPWDAGRYHDDASMDRIRKEVWEPDLAELKRSGKGYMPTAFPGFSWDNLRRAPAGIDDDRPAQGRVLLAAVRHLPGAGHPHRLRRHVRRG